MSLAIPPFNMPRRLDIDRGTRASGSTSRNAATIETLAGKEPIMSALRHLASPIAKSFSEAVRIDTEAGSWIFVAGQVGVAIPSDNKPISFEQEVRVTFDRIRQSLRKLDADLDKIASIKVYLTDLAPYAEFSKVRGEVFPNNPPTSTAVQVAGLLLGARIEIDAVAFIAKE
jgi:enamine deaminase RidA (YjgF/YER057c/UK114 family)